MNAKPLSQMSEKGAGSEHSVSTDLAMDRTYLAAERTLMAWVRTALSMISFGFTIGKLGQVMHDIEVKKLFGNTRTVGVKSLAYFLVVLGIVALLGASVQHWRRLRMLRAMGQSYQFSITFIVALVLACIGVFALTSLTMAL